MQIVASPIFKLSVQRFTAFLTEKYDSNFANEVLAEVKQHIQQQLADFPEIAPLSERLVALGIADYRQWQLDKHNLVFYRINHREQQLELLLLMDSRQSLRKLLFECNLLL